MGLRRARDESTRIELEDGDWLEVRADISKRDFNNLVKSMPQDIDATKGFTPGQATEFGSALFTTLVLGWSSEDEPTVENYLALKREDADTIDTKLSEHFNAFTVPAEEQSKAKK
jgi:hypothetical protein